MVVDFAHVQLWKVEGGENPKIVYLSTLSKHNQAVNVVRFSPRGKQKNLVLIHSKIYQFLTILNR